MDAADHCLDYLSNTDSTRNDQLHGVLDSEDSKEILAHDGRGFFTEDYVLMLNTERLFHNHSRLWEYICIFAAN